MTRSARGGKVRVGKVAMEQTLQTDCYQDPLEEAFEKRFPWSFVFTEIDDDASVHIVADDFSGRQFALPVGAIIEIAEALRAQTPVAN